MPPEDKETQARSQMSAAAVSQVVNSPKNTVPPAPADLDMIEFGFENGVYRYCSEWLSMVGASHSAARPFGLILSRSIPSDEKLLEQKGVTVQRLHAFKSQKMIDPQGCIYIVTQNLELALRIEVDSAQQSQHLFDYIGTINLQDRVICVFEPPPANLIFMRKGLNGTSRAEEVVAAGDITPWTTLQLEGEFDQFHQEYTRTPSCVLVPWSNAGKGVTGEKLELRISKTLANYLDKKWKPGSVLAEVETNSGRIDIFITEHVLAAEAGPAVIEVKVFRSHHGDQTKGRYRKVSPKFTEWWGRKGAVQAELYRTDKTAGSAYLCCFDARDKDKELAAVKSAAKQLNVEYRRYFMFRDTASLQEQMLSNLSP
jgi:hypothetical protein